MKTTKLLYLLLLVLMFSRCNCYKHVDCGDASIQPAFIGFQPSEIDTLVVLKYKAGDGFRQPLDTLTVTNNGNYWTRGDTTQVTTFYPPDRNIRTGFDWRIVIPALSRTVSVSEIRSDKGSTRCGAMARDCWCFNKLYSAQVDNATVTFPDVNIQQPFLYIRR